MGLFNFLRKKQMKNNNLQKKIKLEEFESWIKKKKSSDKEEEEKLIGLIEKRILQFIQELEQEADALEKININEKKVEEKIKAVVKESLGNYNEHLRRLVIELKNIEKENISRLAERIKSIFSNFENKSKMSFQKSTLLIGKELDAVKRSKNSFLKDLENFLGQNKQIIDNLKIMRSVGWRVNKLSETEKTKKTAEEKNRDILQRVDDLKDNIKALEESIKRIKKTKEYLDEEKRIEEIEKNKQELKEEIYRLREMIDFKFLADKFHSDGKKMWVIKQYKENFLEAFERDNGSEILVLLSEAKINKEKISEKIKEITEKKNEIENTPLIIISKNKIKELEIEIKKAEAEIGNLNSEKYREEKIIEKLEKNKEEIINIIREELAKINAIIE